MFPLLLNTPTLEVLIGAIESRAVESRRSHVVSRIVLSEELLAGEVPGCASLLFRRITPVSSVIRRLPREELAR